MYIQYLKNPSRSGTIFVSKKKKTGVVKTEWKKIYTIYKSVSLTLIFALSELWVWILTLSCKIVFN